MLKKCPECELQVSDKARICPHCGFPLAKEAKKPKPKRMRLPNGFGSIYEAKSRPLRKPFYAKVCIGRTETGRLKYKPLKPRSSFATYQEAYEALIAYNKDPYVFEKAMTVKEVYEAWIEEVEEKNLKANIRNYKAAWKYCYVTYDMDFKSIRPAHIRACIEDSEVTMPSGRYAGKPMKPTDTVSHSIKCLWNFMFDYAIEHGLVEQNYARTFSAHSDKRSKPSVQGHITFTDDEMKALWKASETDKYAAMILILCYSGLRPGELCDMKRKNIDLVNDTMVGGLKTEAGRNRIVPIHHRIKSFIKLFYQESEDFNSEYLLNRLDSVTKRGRPMKYDGLKYRFELVVKSLDLNPKHNPHDCRKHFITMAKTFGMDDYAIKRIAGHQITDLTERVYTERPVSWLKSEIEKIP